MARAEKLNSRIRRSPQWSTVTLIPTHSTWHFCVTNPSLASSKSSMKYRWLGQARCHLLPQANSAFVTFNGFLFLCEEANYVVVSTREHRNTRSAYPVLQWCCLSYERNINNCLHLSSHCVKCQVVEGLRNFRVLANRTLLPSAARQRWWMARLTLAPRPPTTLRSRPQLHSLIAPSGAQPTQSACH